MVFYNYPNRHFNRKIHTTNPAVFHRYHRQDPLLSIQISCALVS